MYTIIAHNPFEKKGEEEEEENNIKIEVGKRVVEIHPSNTHILKTRIYIFS